MKTGVWSLSLAAAALSCASPAGASTVAQREYDRGYKDCLAGHYDQLQHGAAYKRGCRAAEESGNTTGHTIQNQADAKVMRAICDGAVTGRFNPHARVVKIQNVEHQNYGWGVFGSVVLDDGRISDFVCMFSSTGVFKRVNAGEPFGGVNEVDHEEYCPPDVSEADRYKYPGCD
jgi:hypothetical protein